MNTSITAKTNASRRRSGAGLLCAGLAVAVLAGCGSNNDTISDQEPKPAVKAAFTNSSQSNKPVSITATSLGDAEATKALMKATEPKLTAQDVKMAEMMSKISFVVTSNNPNASTEESQSGAMKFSLDGETIMESYTTAKEISMRFDVDNMNNVMKQFPAEESSSSESPVQTFARIIKEGKDSTNSGQKALFSGEWITMKSESIQALAKPLGSASSSSAPNMTPPSPEKMNRIMSKMVDQATVTRESDNKYKVTVSDKVLRDAMSELNSSTTMSPSSSASSSSVKNVTIDLTTEDDKVKLIELDTRQLDEKTKSLASAVGVKIEFNYGAEKVEAPKNDVDVNPAELLLALNNCSGLSCDLKR